MMGRSVSGSLWTVAASSTQHPCHAHRRIRHGDTNSRRAWRCRMKLNLFTIIVVLGLLASSASLGFAIRGHVIANGGISATPASNGAYRLYGTAGQAGVGKSHSATSMA